MRSTTILIVLVLVALATTPPVARRAAAAPAIATWPLFGQGLGDRFGDAVLIADVDRDRYGDFIVGAPRTDPNGKNDAGSVYVFSGKTHALLTRLDGEAAGEWLGFSLAVGDTDRDHYPDLIVGAPFADPGGASDAGSVYVFSGKDFSKLHRFDGFLAGDRAGFSVASADLNRDKYGDVVLGVPFGDRPAPPAMDAGYLTAYSGKDGAILQNRYGNGASDMFGWRVACADLDRDKYGDVVVSALVGDSPTIQSAGAVTAYSGKNSQLIRQFFGPKAQSFFGFSLACYDVNRDHYPDILVGATNADFGSTGNCGTVSIYSGQSGLPLTIIGGPASGDHFGWSVACADFLRDKKVDVLIGATGTDTPGPEAGSVRDFVLTGNVATPAGAVITGSAGEGLGRAIVCGTIDGNKNPDFVLGNPFLDFNGLADAGAAVAWLW